MGSKNGFIDIIAHCALTTLLLLLRVRTYFYESSFPKMASDVGTYNIILIESLPGQNVINLNFQTENYDMTCKKFSNARTKKKSL